MTKKQFYLFISIFFIMSLVLGACQTASVPAEEPVVEHCIVVAGTAADGTVALAAFVAGTVDTAVAVVDYILTIDY